MSFSHINISQENYPPINDNCTNFICPIYDAGRATESYRDFSTSHPSDLMARLTFLALTVGAALPASAAAARRDVTCDAAPATYASINDPGLPNPWKFAS